MDFACLSSRAKGAPFVPARGLQTGRRAAPATFPQALVKRLDNLYHPLLRKLRDLPLPIITAVNGAAAGIGISFALMGDLVLAARSAYFLQAFARIGLVPDGGSTWLLPRLIGLARARELSLLAEKLPAEKALDWGLINRVYDDTALIDEALKMAEKLAQGPTVALAIMRRMYWESPNNTYEEQLEVERHSQQRAGGETTSISPMAAGRWQPRSNAARRAFWYQFQFRLVVSALPVAGDRPRAAPLNRDVAYSDLQSNYGHDAFLVDVVEQTDLIRGFLKSAYRAAHE